MFGLETINNTVVFFVKKKNSTKIVKNLLFNFRKGKKYKYIFVYLIDCKDINNIYIYISKLTSLLWWGQ